MTNKQPSETTELMNASYIWRKKVQEDLLEVLRDPLITVDKASWWFERWTNAKLREIEYEKLAAEERNK